MVPCRTLSHVEIHVQKFEFALLQTFNVINVLFLLYMCTYVCRQEQQHERVDPIIHTHKCTCTCIYHINKNCIMHLLVLAS